MCWIGIEFDSNVEAIEHCRVLAREFVHRHPADDAINE
jgi:hypothetical protein